MKHKILIAYDGTSYALKAVEYTANIVKCSCDSFELVLFFVLPPLPIDYVEYGDLYGNEAEVEKLKNRRELLEQLKKDTESRMSKIFDRPVNLLKTYGINNVICKFSHCTTDVAGEIVKEVEANMYKTVVIGRRGRSSIKELLLGGTAEKIVRHVKECAVWVV